MLAHAILDPPSGAPTGTTYILHGILGAGRNWRSIARKLAARTGHRVVLPDLPNHGGSGPGARSLKAAAAAVGGLHQHVGSPDTIVGHSFGGKVALAHARDFGTPVVWVLDAVPFPTPASLVADDHSSPARVIAAAEAVRTPSPDRASVREALLRAGLSPPLVQWLLTSLIRSDRGWVWVWDLDGISAMLEDYARTDFGPWLHTTPADVHLVRALRSQRWTDEVLARLEDLPRTTVHALDAGHWVHVDAPSEVVELLSRRSGE